MRSKRCSIARSSVTRGLSEVSIEDIEAASKVFRVATVQNRYNIINRSSEDVLEYCEKHAIGFIPLVPARGRRVSQTRLERIEGRKAPSRHAWPDCAGMVAEAKPGDVADPRNLESRAS